MFAVDCELVTLMKEVPDLKKRMDELAKPRRRLPTPCYARWRGPE